MEKKDDYNEILKILMQLDRKSLLLVESGAKLLISRQNMESEGEDNSNE